MKNKLQPEHTIDNSTMAMLTNLCLALTEAMRLIKAPPERMQQLELGDIAELYFWLKGQNPVPAIAVRCMDCGLDYEHDFPLDVVLTKEQWLLIHPQDGGVLCGNCIVKRAAKLPHVINLTATIKFASDFDDVAEPSNEKADLPPTKARQPRSGTEGVIGG